MAHFLDAPVREAQARALTLANTTVVFRRRDLLAAGVPDAIQSAMYRRGLLVRLRHGVYVLSEQIDGATAAELHRVHLAAAIAAADEPTWGFGASAALVHGFPLPFDVPAHVELLRQARQDERSLARPSRHRLSLPNMRVTTHAVAARDVTTVGGVPVVSAPLAAVAAARTLSPRWQVALCDAALWDGTVTSEDLTRLNEEWRSRGGKVRLDAAIARARQGAQTVLETFSRLALVDQGLAEPQLQVAFHDRGGLIGYVDMCWADLRVIGEADGRVKYSSRDDLVREKVREDRLRALGFRVVRWMWDDIHERPAEIARRIRERDRLSA
jgi:very-short-patch-repair endonuclease